MTASLRPLRPEATRKARKVNDGNTDGFGAPNVIFGRKIRTLMFDIIYAIFLIRIKIKNTTN